MHEFWEGDTNEAGLPSFEGNALSRAKVFSYISKIKNKITNSFGNKEINRTKSFVCC